MGTTRPPSANIALPYYGAAPALRGKYPVSDCGPYTGVNGIKAVFGLSPALAWTQWLDARGNSWQLTSAGGVAPITLPEPIVGAIVDLYSWANNAADATIVVGIGESGATYDMPATYSGGSAGTSAVPALPGACKLAGTTWGALIKPTAQPVSGAFQWAYGVSVTASGALPFPQMPIGGALNFAGARIPVAVLANGDVMQLGLNPDGSQSWSKAVLQQVQAGNPDIPMFADTPCALGNLP